MCGSNEKEEEKSVEISCQKGNEKMFTGKDANIEINFREKNTARVRYVM